MASRTADDSRHPFRSLARLHRRSHSEAAAYRSRNPVHADDSDIPLTPPAMSYSFTDPRYSSISPPRHLGHTQARFVEPPVIPSNVAQTEDDFVIPPVIPPLVSSPPPGLARESGHTNIPTSSWNTMASYSYGRIPPISPSHEWKSRSTSDPRARGHLPSTPIRGITSRSPHSSMLPPTPRRRGEPISRRVPIMSFYPADFEPYRRNDDDNYDREWDELGKELREYDQTMIKDRCDNIDNLMVFAALFSAVVGAFTIEAYQALQSTSNNSSTSSNSSSPSNTSCNSTQLDSSSQSSIPQSIAVWINILWFCSLVFSLFAASLGLLLKQWLAEYLTGHFASSPEYVRVRYHRWHNFHQWHVFDMEAAIITLLQTALGLFSIGLGGLLLKLNIAVGGVIITCIALWMLFVAISILAPFVSSRCPYKIVFFTALASRARHAISMYLGRELWDEARVREHRGFDIPAIIAADEAFGDDQLLLKTLRPCVATVEGQDAIKFLQAILGHRLYPFQGPVDAGSMEWHPSLLSRLTNPALKAILHILLDALEAEFNTKINEPNFRHGNEVTLEWKPQCHWIDKGLRLLFDVLLYANLKDRHLGEAMDRGASLPLRILRIKNDFLSMKCIELLVEYDLACKLWDLDQDATDRAVHNARRLVGLGRITLLQMTRVILESMIPQQKSVDRRDFSSLLSLLNEQLQTETHDSDDEACASACLHTCNMIMTRTQDQALIAWAERLAKTLISLDWGGIKWIYVT